MNKCHSTYVYKGGRGSLKSSMMALKVVLSVINGDGNALCVRRYKATLRDSCYADIQVAIDRLGLSSEFVARLSPMEFRHSSGLAIYFRGLDDPSKIKSIRPKVGNFAFLWVEEATEVENEVKLRSVQQSVGRGLGGRLITGISYNPHESPDNWCNKAFEFCKDSDTVVLHSTYMDVPSEWLGDLFINTALKLREHDHDAYSNEYLGKIVSGKGTVFKKVYTLTPDMEFSRSRLFRGLDFGYTNDPSVYVVWAYDKKMHSIYLVHEVYGFGMTNESLAREILDEHEAVKRGWEGNGDFALRVYCDSAEAKSRDHFRRLGVKGMESCSKGADSVRHGVKWLQSLNGIYIPSNTHTYKEFSNYTFAKNSNGDFINEYPDKNNHTIDATRYALQDVISGRV